jgi:imidazolonepropionase-like amidohydrolase
MKHALDDKRIRSALPEKVLKEYSSEEYYRKYRERYPNTSLVKSHLDVLRRNMMKLHNHKVLIAMGTDMWALPGVGAHLELEYMVNAGMSPMEALVCATKTAAQFVSNGGSSLGTIEPETAAGNAKWPDLLILDADPLKDIRNTRSVRTIIKRGQIFDHQQLIEESKR